MSFADELRAARVLPVVTAQDVESTVALTRVLVKGGMRAVEITLRTDAALDSIREVKAAIPGVQVAAGTITNPLHMERAMAAGADFCVSPGISEALLHCAGQNSVNFLPGVATASDVMLGLDFGVEMFKLFPAEAVGGIGLIKSLGGPFPSVSFCPTGGLTPENFREYLALSNVICCGGSWMASGALVNGQCWDEIEDLARVAMRV